MTECEGECPSNVPSGGDCSEIPGNIGTLKAKIQVWDHDPVLARPNQEIYFPINRNAFNQSDKKDIKDVVLDPTGAGILRPIFEHNDMFVAAEDDNLQQSPNGYDFVGIGPSRSGQLTSDKLPGGTQYESGFGVPGDPELFVDRSKYQAEFPHDVWIMDGSLLDDNTYILPRQYNDQFGQILSENGLPNTTESLDKIADSAKWTMTEDSEERIVSPYMTDKHTNRLTSTVHWSLKKFTPFFRGQDFIVTVTKGDKVLDAPKDPVLEVWEKKSEQEKQLGPTGDEGVFGSEYHTDIEPSADHDIYNVIMPIPSVSSFASDTFQFKQGITNEAFTVPIEDNDQQGNDADLQSKGFHWFQTRERYWWKYKTYILLELGGEAQFGSFPNDHWYFIEIVKGRNPRFLHMGEVFDETATSSSGKEFKCRVLSEWNVTSSDTFFNMDGFTFSVRNVMGRIVVTFSGYEDQPWIITRQDPDFPSLRSEETGEEFDASSRKDTLQLVTRPCVVAHASPKIFGGNISCKINISPIKYEKSGVFTFRDIQMDTRNAEAENIYVTLSQMGASYIERRGGSQKKIQNIFDEVRLNHQFLGYDCDAYEVQDIIKGEKSDKIVLYDIFREKYKRIGKGWIFADETLIKENQRHKILIENPNGEGFNEFGIDDETYEFRDYVTKFDVRLRLVAGSVTFPPKTTFDDNVGSYVLDNCITPICKGFRFMVLGAEKPIAGNIDEPLDITELVIHINETWSADEFHMLRHQANLECYIPVGQPLVNEQNYDTGRALLSMKDKAMYITVAYWWENGVGEEFSPGLLPKIRTLTAPRIQMTGIAYGGKIERRANRIFMSLEVKDYMTIFENQYMFNSPFFDAVNSTMAVYEIAKMAGFDDAQHASQFMIDRSSERSVGVDRRPLGFLQKVMQEHNKPTPNEEFFYNGDWFMVQPYSLPGSYADIANPAMRFNNGERFDSALQKIAQLSSKTLYFDRWGVLKFETSPALLAAFDVKKRKRFRSIYDFVTSPLTALLGEEDEGVVTSNFRFDPDTDAAHLVHNVLHYERDVESAVNQITLMSATNNEILSDGRRVGGYIIEGFTFFDQMWNPEAEGFIGYRKVFYNSEGLYGSREGVINAMKHYAKFKFPPVEMSFETFGVPGLKPLDIITLDKNPAYILEISHDIIPAENKWWMNITAEWFKSDNEELVLLQDPELVNLLPGF